MTDDKEARRENAVKMTANLRQAAAAYEQLFRALSEEEMPPVAVIKTALTKASVLSASPVGSNFDVKVKLSDDGVFSLTVDGWPVLWERPDQDWERPDQDWEQFWEDKIGQQVIQGILEIEIPSEDHTDIVVSRVEKDYPDLKYDMVPGLEGALIDYVEGHFWSSIAQARLGFSEHTDRLRKEAMAACLAIPESERARVARASVRGMTASRLVQVLGEAMAHLSEEDISLAIGEARARAVLDS
jgi:hypothetical protein